MLASDPDALSSPIPGMNAEIMADYIEFIADRLLVTLGCDTMFNKKNPVRITPYYGCDHFETPAQRATVPSTVSFHRHYCNERQNELLRETGD